MKMQRASYALIMKRYKKIGKSTVRLTQSTLMLMKDIDPKTTTYTYPVLTTDKPDPQPEEIRLNQNDEFISYEVGFFLKGKLENAANNEFTSTLFTSSPIELSEKFIPSNNAYFGNLSILVNKISRLENWDLQRHQVKNRTQFASSSVGLPVATAPSADLSQDGWYTMQPMLTLSGAKKNTITTTHDYNIVAGVDKWALPTGGSINVYTQSLLMGFRGMLAQNASSFQ